MATVTNNPNNAPSQQELLSKFESLLDTLVNTTSSTARASAEEQLSSAKESNLLLYLECLLQLTLKSSNREIKQLSIVMFRQCVQPNNINSETWEKIPPSAYNVFENGLLTALTKETDFKTYLILCDAIGTLASRILPKGYWKDLLSNLLQLANNNNEKNAFHKQGFLRVLDTLAEYCIDFLRPNFSNIYGVIDTAISDTNNRNVQLTAYKSFISIVISLDNIDDINKWKSLIPKCLSLLQCNNEKILNEVLSCTIDLVSHRFMLIRDVFDKLLLNPIIELVRNDSFSFETRKLSFEILVVMATNNAALLRQHEQYMNAVVQLSIYFLSLYDDSLSFANMEDDIEQQYIWNARQWIKELAETLGGAAYLSVAESIIKQGLKSSQWKQCYASLQTFTQIIKYIKDIKGWQIEMECDTECVWDLLIPQILSFCTNNKQNIRPEIKHSAWFVIKTVINHYNGAFQQRYYKIFYDAVLKTLMNNKSEHNRVLIQCVKCVSHFHSNGAQVSQFRDSSDIILKYLSKMITDNKVIDNPLIAHCVTCIGTCSDVMQSYFLQYYDKFMPIMLNIITNKQASGTLRGKAMECIGMIGESVGNARFMTDAHKLMSVLLPFRDELKSDKHDVTAYNYMNQLFARISRCIGDSFIQYLSVIIPDLLQSASLEAAQMLQPSDAAPLDERYSVFTVHLRGIGDTKFCINPISLEEKDSACHMLYQFVKDQCYGFFPYVLATANAMKSLMRYQYNARVRTAATTIVPLLLKCVIKNKDKVKNDDYQRMFHELFAAFIEALLAEPDVVETVPLLEILAQIASVVGDEENKGFYVFNDAQLKSIADVLFELISESCQRSKERIDDELGSKLIVDEEKRNEILWANDIESELIAHCIDVIEYTLRANNKFIQYFELNGLAECVKNNMLFVKEEKYRNDTLRLQALCIFIDCIEFCATTKACNEYMNWLFPLCGKCINDCNEDKDIKQTAIYAMGIFAQCGGYLQTFDPQNKYLNIFMHDIEQFNVQQHDGDEDESDILIYENMVSAMGKIIRYSSPKNEQVLFENWCKLLPCYTDEEEFNSIAGNLLYFIGCNKFKIKNELRSRILFCLLVYLARFKDKNNLTSYDLIMKYNVDLSDDDKFPSKVPVLNHKNIQKIKQLKEDPVLKKAKAFEQVMQRLQPQEIQNIQYVVNNH